MVIADGKEDQAEAIFRKWGLGLRHHRQDTDTLRFVVKHDGDVKADLPIKELGDEAPEYYRPFTETPPRPVLGPSDVNHAVSVADALERLIASPDCAPSAGSGSSMTTSSSATPCSARAAMRPWCV